MQTELNLKGLGYWRHPSGTAAEKLEPDIVQGQSKLIYNMPTEKVHEERWSNIRHQNDCFRRYPITRVITQPYWHLSPEMSTMSKLFGIVARTK